MALALCILWSAVVLYVFIDVRRIMAFNNRVNKRVLGMGDLPITDKSVMINRVFLVVVLVARPERASAPTPVSAT